MNFQAKDLLIQLYVHIGRYLCISSVLENGIFIPLNQFIEIQIFSITEDYLSNKHGYISTSNHLVSFLVILLSGLLLFRQIKHFHPFKRLFCTPPKDKITKIHHHNLRNYILHIKQLYTFIVFKLFQLDLNVIILIKIIKLQSNDKKYFLKCCMNIVICLKKMTMNQTKFEMYTSL